VYSGVPLEDRGDTPESWWIYLKVGIQCVLFLVRVVLWNFASWGGFGIFSCTKMPMY